MVDPSLDSDSDSDSDSRQKGWIQVQIQIQIRIRIQFHCWGQMGMKRSDFHVDLSRCEFLHTLNCLSKTPIFDFPKVA